MPSPPRICHWKLTLLGLVLLTISGCNAVLSKRPVGEHPARIVAKEWEGNWITTDGVIKIKVIDADKGTLRTSWLEDDKDGNPALKSAEIEIRESEGWLLANTREEKGRGYVWGRIQNEDRQIVIWSPNDKLFAQAVKDGILPGRLEGDEVILGDLKPQHLKIITSTEKGVLFSWDKPSIFVKTGN